MASQQIILFDIMNRQGKCWSPNVWKTRLLLNFMGLDYKTEWVEYPDIEPTLKGHVPPRRRRGENDDDPLYTLPAVLFPDGTHVMESSAIARELQARYPAAALGPAPAAVALALESPERAAMLPHHAAAWDALFPLVAASVPRLLLPPRSAEYFAATRGRDVGCPVEQFERERGPAALDDARRDLVAATDLLRRRAAEGPFLGGASPVYGDFIWAGFLLFMSSIEQLDAVLEATGDADVHRRLLEAVKPWSERDD